MALTSQSIFSGKVEFPSLSETNEVLVEKSLAFLAKVRVNYL